MISCILSAAAGYCKPVASPPNPAPREDPQAKATIPVPKRILVVDDDPVILRTIAWKLSAQGYAVVTAEDASAAIGAVRDEHPDLILMDLDYPPDVGYGGLVTWDGWQIMAWLRGLHEVQHVPFIVISGSEPDLFEKRSRQCGAVAFFQKPIQHDDLLRVVEQTLEPSLPEAA